MEEIYITIIDPVTREKSIVSAYSKDHAKRIIQLML